MAIHVALRHVTHYSYDQAVSHGPHVIRLRPAPHCRTPILSYSQRITGGEHFLHWQQDPFSNWNARVVFPEPMRELKIEIELVAEMAVYNPFDFFLEDSAIHHPFEYGAALAKDLEPFLIRPASGPRFDALVADLKARWGGPGCGGSGRAVRTIDFVVGLNQHLQRSIRYLIRLEPGVQSPEETLTLGSGSCRDSAWLLVQLFRSMGVAARFVSGYLIQLAPDQKSLDGPSGTEVDFTDLHAWCEVYLPGAGWIGLDPTSGLLAGEGHIPLSCTPEPASAAPVTGGIGKCESKLHHEMQVTRIHESPRVTRPYTEEQWARIQSLGHRIDEELRTGDVRLTMGGEPTFVSIDDPEGAEWNFTAVSPAKRVLSATLLKRLRARMAPGSLLHYGQGKWYPGEPLPRWALSAYWRKDGVPLWKDDSLIADESKDYGHGTAEASELIRRLARELGVDPGHVLPAYEDLFYYTWKERRLPSNVSPTSSNWKDPQERERLARVFQRGLGEVVGYALPLEVAGGPGGDIRWRSGAWFLRDDETLWLIPGDSAMGLRLPLDSIPWVAEREYPWVWPQDPSAPLPPLPGKSPGRPPVPSSGQAFVAGALSARPAGTGPGLRAQALTTARDPRDGQAPAPGQSAPWIVRTALCVEPRDGRLHVFLPPVATTEAYLDLVSTLESTVSAMGVPVILEGEAPPRDPRINKLSVTPDPGVIEVNLHPSRTWEELVDRTTVLYEEARQTRLRAEKFMLDGRHSGTGGGNHIILGGETPGD